MPIEIKELQVSINISKGNDKKIAGGDIPKGATPQGSKEPIDKQAIISACVEQVMAIIHEQKER